ncbi:MAG: organic hydroperoxide resistance protein [Acidimicrobiales bacterium]
MVTEIAKELYTAKATAVGGRAGHVKSSDGLVDVDLRRPVEMGGPGGATNPEQLFAAGYSACFQGAMGLVAKRSDVNTDDSTVTASVTLGTAEGGALTLAVTLEVHIPGVDLATAQELADGAHQVCPYSNATRGNIKVTVTAV